MKVFKKICSFINILIIIVLAAIVGVLIGAVMAPMLAMYKGLDNL